MRNLRLFLLVSLILLTVFSLSARMVDILNAKMAAEHRMARMGKSESHEIIAYEAIQGKDGLNGYLFKLSPVGFIIVSADTDLPPVMGYSFSTDFSAEPEHPAAEILQADLDCRRANIDIIPKELRTQRNQAWSRIRAGAALDGPGLEQWPPEGHTNTEGWVTSLWKQTHPYNQFVPIDPSTNQRSYAGCPSICQAQIMNFQKNINMTIFSDDDDYVMNWPPRVYTIDDDYMERGFLNFTQLNEYLDTIRLKYFLNDELTYEEKAALIFACGVAATHVYSSAGSGTMGIEHGYTGYPKFGYDDAVLILHTDPDPEEQIIANMMEGRPVQYATVNEAWNSGHNFVVDGYNTDGFFHTNYGWGGQSNGWYLLPEQVVMGLTVFEGCIVDIGIPMNDINEEKKINQPFPMKTGNYPNPFNPNTTISFSIPESGDVTLKIYNIMGQEVNTLVSGGHYQAGSHSVQWNGTDSSGSGVASGIYFYTVSTAKESVSGKMVLMK